LDKGLKIFAQFSTQLRTDGITALNRRQTNPIKKVGIDFGRSERSDTDFAL
jgi:hypothetical protein